MSQPNIVEKLLEKRARIYEIRSKLVDSDLFTDVTFTFPSRIEGNAASSVKAHKVFLVSASPVFYAMFCGSLSSSLNEVVIEDISREDFIVMLNEIYAGDAILNFANIYGVWYAAQKYLLDEMIEQCADFVCTGVNNSNVLDVFNSVQPFDNRKVDNACLKILLDRPDQHFEANEIVKMNKDAFRKLIPKLKIQCSVEFLEAISLEWLNYQKQTMFCCFAGRVQQIFEEEFSIKPIHFEKKQTYNLDLAVNYLDSTLFESMDLDYVHVDCDDELHGIGIYVGIDTDQPILAINSEWVVFEVGHETYFQRKILLKYTIQVQQEFTPSILRIIFKKKIKVKGKITISIKFPFERRRAINPMSLNKKSFGKLTLPRERTCIAYLIEKPKESEQ